MLLSLSAVEQGHLEGVLAAGVAVHCWHLDRCGAAGAGFGVLVGGEAHGLELVRVLELDLWEDYATAEGGFGLWAC